MGNKKTPPTKSMESIRQQAMALIQQTAEAAVSALNTDDFIGAYRKLSSVIQEAYTAYIYSWRNIDCSRGLPDTLDGHDEIPDYGSAWISEQLFAMMELCNSPRLVNMVKNYDPSRIDSPYAFFLYLKSTLELDVKKLSTESTFENQHHGITQLHSRGMGTHSRRILRRVKSLLEVKTAITKADIVTIAEGLGLTCAQVTEVLQAEHLTSQQAEIDRELDEDSDTLADILSDDTSLSPEVLLLQFEGQEQPAQLESLYARMTAAEQRVFPYYATAQLIRQELRTLQHKLQDSDSRVNSVPALFRMAEDLATQHLRNVKHLYLENPNPLIVPMLFDYAITEKKVPTQNDIAAMLSVSAPNINQIANKVIKQIKSR